MNWFDRVIMWFSPSWGQSRVRARVLARHFEAAAVGRRTSGWNRTVTDPNSAVTGATLTRLRAQARDLVRNNPWACEGIRAIKDDTVGWGIKPKATGRGAARVMELWKKWGETTQCDAEGQLDFYGLQALVMRTIVESGEVLVRRRVRRPEDGLAIPMQLEVLEPDYIDTSKDNIALPNGGRITLGIETDAIGRRVAYWLFEQHPGGNTFMSAASRRIPADGVLHIFDKQRAQQKRGHSWFAPVDVRLHDFDEFEDATLMKQKIASCMAAFVTDADGEAPRLGGDDQDDEPTGAQVDTFEPGMILNLPPGKSVTVAQPPQASDYQSFSTAQLRGVAAGLGIPYEALTGDFSQVNYSSARMAWNKYARHIESWRWQMLIPQFCAAAWSWMLDIIALTGERVENAPAEWTPPPMPMLDPEKEGAATMKAVRAGQKTPDEMVRELGHDPEEHWKNYADSFGRLDKLGIVLDCDPRKISSGGQAQAQASATTGKAATPDDGQDDGEGEGTDERYYAEIRYVFDAALASESKRADSAEARVTAMRAALHEDDEAIRATINAANERAAAERERADELAAEARNEAGRLIAERDREHLAELAKLNSERERLMVENARISTELRLISEPKLAAPAALNDGGSPEA